MNDATIHAEQARVLAHEMLPAQQYLLRLDVPKCAAAVEPGNFIHLSCDRNPYRLKRPFSVMRSSPADGWIEILYKIVGSGTRALAQAKRGDYLHCLGPIGNSFELSDRTVRPLLLGGGVGIPPILFFAEQLQKQHAVTPMVIMGSEIPFPFKVQPSTKLIDGIPTDTIAAMSLLEDLSIPSRLTSKQGYAGCYDGYIHELATLWLEHLDAAARSEVEIFACGPVAMLRAVAVLSQAYNIPCQLSLEEYMACAVGGCAGCTVLVEEAGGQAMRRVCVDGPVFSANSVFPPSA